MDQVKLANIFVRHAVASQKFGKGLARKIVTQLNSADADLVEGIATRYAVIAAKGYDRGPATTKRLEDTLEAIRKINSEVYSKIADGLSVDLQDAAKHEMEFADKAIGKVGGSITYGTTIPDADFLATLVTNSPITGYLFASWTATLETNRFARLEQAVRDSAVNGKSVNYLIDLIRGTKAKGYTDGILEISRQSAETFVLTANSTIQNTARLEVFRASKSIAYVEWSSVLDSRTSTICQSLSGQIFPLDSAHPTPPAHMRCRSLLLPRKNDTDAPLHQPYDVWLKKQNAGIQDEVLGKTRGKAFRDGKLKSADLYRTDGSFASLSELKASDARIFDH